MPLNGRDGGGGGRIVWSKSDKMLVGLAQHITFAMKLFYSPATRKEKKRKTSTYVDKN